MPDSLVLKKTLDQPARLADGLGIKVNPVRSWISPNDWFPRFTALYNWRCEFGLPDGVHRINRVPHGFTISMVCYCDKEERGVRRRVTHP